MKLYFECRMGAAGDMIMAALYELLPDKKAFRDKMERLNLPGVKMEYSEAVKCGVKGTHIAVKVGDAEEKSEDAHMQNASPTLQHSHAHGKGSKPHTHSNSNKPLTSVSSGETHTHADGKPHTHGSSEPHSHDSNSNSNSNSSEPHAHADGTTHTHATGAKRYSYKEITDTIKSLDLPDNIANDALAVYKILAEAEASVHGVTLDKLHLHEVGALDAVADVIGCCTAISSLGVTDIHASPIHVGSGSVKCEHGILPVPAPAAAEILKGVPIYGGSIEGELCTPTGAAILKHFVKHFGAMPSMVVDKIGCGMGAKDFAAANCLRAFLCEDGATDGNSRDYVFEIACNLDDMSPEAIGAAFDVLYDNGALDVFAVHATMKKNRPGIVLSCLCAEESREKLARLMLEHTTTLGVRITKHERSILSRSVEFVKTQYGDIRVKSAHGFGVKKDKPEYDDVMEAAKRCKVPFSNVFDAAMSAVQKKA